MFTAYVLPPRPLAFCSGLPPRGVHFSLGQSSRKTSQLVREYTITAVDPGQSKWQIGQHLHQRMADMPTAEQRNRAPAQLQSLSQCASVHGTDHFKPDIHHAATALPQRRAQRETLSKGLCRTACRQQLTCCVNSLVFNLATPNCGDQRILKNCHPGASIARPGSFDLHHLHQHCWLIGHMIQKLLQMRRILENRWRHWM